MNTEQPPPPLSNAEAVQILTDGRLLASLTPRQKDAVLRAVHLVARREAKKVRYAHRKADKGACFTPDAVLANPPFAPDARYALAGRSAVRPRSGDEPSHGNGGRE